MKSEDSVRNYFKGQSNILKTEIRAAPTNVFLRSPCYLNSPVTDTVKSTYECGRQPRWEEPTGPGSPPHTMKEGKPGRQDKFSRSLAVCLWKQKFSTKDEPGGRSVAAIGRGILHVVQ